MIAIIGTLFGALFFLMMASLTILAFVFWIWMLVDCVLNRGIELTEKVVWAVVIALTHFIGAALYFFIGRPRGRLAPR